MDNILALVLAGGRVDELLCLTETRAKASVTIFGIYRIIDFVLSNLMHSGIENVGILSQYRPQDLVRHISSGEHWDYVGRKRAIRILAPYSGFKGSDWYRGTADAVYQNISYIEEFLPEHILVAAADHIYRMDYTPMIEFHLEKKADATICFTKIRTKSSRFGYGITNKEQRLIKYLEKPSSPPSDLVSMTLYIFRTKYILNVLKDNAAESSHEFGRDIIPRIIADRKTYAYIFNDYWAYARTIASYYGTNMDLIKHRINLNKWQIRTNLLERCKYRDRTPAYIKGAVSNSVVSDECIIEGDVRNSILSPGVRVAHGAVVSDSIIFHDVKIAPFARLKKVICDKDAKIGEHSIIGGFGNKVKSKNHNKFLGSGITVLGKNSSIPDHTRIGANTVIYPSARITNNDIQPGSTVI
jgi:glucose-1-phosphate adenylyltransferase